MSAEQLDITATSIGSSVRAKAGHVLEAIGTAAAAFAGLLVILMGGHIVLDVLSRTLANRPLSGTLELATHFWMPAVALLGLGYAEFCHDQVRMTLATDGISERLARALDVAIELLTLVVAAWLAYLAFGALEHSLRIQEAAPSNSWILLWPGRALLAVSFVVYATSALGRIVLPRKDRPVADLPQPVS